MEKRYLGIGLVLVFAVIVITFLAVFAPKLVGQAIQLPADSLLTTPGTAGFTEKLSLPRTAGQILSIPVGAVLPAGKESVGFSFVLQYPTAMVEPQDAQPWLVEWGNDFRRATMGNGVLTFEHATLDYTQAIHDAVYLVQLNFVVKEGQNVGEDVLDQFRFTDFKVWDLDTNVNLITASNTLSGALASCPEPVADALLCGAFCSQDGSKTSYCNYAQECGTRGACALPPPAAAYTADLTLDSKYDGQDAQVIFATRDARNNNACGQLGIAPCIFDKLYVCDDGSFRVAGSTIYNKIGGVFQAYAHQSHTCPYTMEAR